MPGSSTPPVAMILIQSTPAAASCRTTFWHSSAPVHTDGLRLASLTAAASSGGSPVASIGVATDDRQRRARDLDPRSGEAAFRDGISDGDHRARIAPEVADGGEAAARHLKRMVRPTVAE